MKKALLLLSLLFAPLLSSGVYASQMTEEEMRQRIAELEERLRVVEVEQPVSWTDPRFSSHLSEVFVESYHVFNIEFGDGNKSGFVRERNKILGMFGKATGTEIGRVYAVHQLRDNTSILSSDPKTWANQGIEEAEKHLGIANRLSGFVFEKYFPDKAPIVIS